MGGMSELERRLQEVEGDIRRAEQEAMVNSEQALTQAAAAATVASVS